MKGRMMNPKECHHKVGEQVGPFSLERLLGQGASAEVWLVNEQGELGFTKRQALKLLRPPPGDIEGQKMALINEARVCGRLKHRGLVDVYRVGEHGGELYIAMEYVEGPDLNSLLSALRRRAIPIPVRAALEAAIELAEALEHAHTRVDDDGKLLGIVHRDLKPSNVLVDRDGTLKISDWGLVKSSLNIEATSRGIVKGTPGYIAPEVWGGTRDFKPTADLFALGAMLYEMIVGERLFRGKNLARIAEQVARRKPDEEAARVRERCPELEAVITRMLQRAPGRRYSTAEGFAASLRPVRDRYSADEGITPFLLSIRDLIDELGPLMTRVPSSVPEAPQSAPPGLPNIAGSGQATRGPVVTTQAAPASLAGRSATFDTVPAVDVDVTAKTDFHPSVVLVDSEDETSAPPQRDGSASPLRASRDSIEGSVTQPERPSLTVASTRPMGSSPAVGVPPARPETRAPKVNKRRRPPGPVRKTGPSVGLGLGVSFLGIALFVFGAYTYWDGGF
jgi:serine/threonine-protein kinase